MNENDRPHVSDTMSRLAGRILAAFRSVVFRIAGTPAGRWVLRLGDRVVRVWPGAHARPLRIVLIVLGALLTGILALGLGIGVDVYRTYSSIVERRLGGTVFSDTATIYAAPRIVYPGHRITAANVVERLERAGFELVAADTSEGALDPDAGTALRDDATGGMYEWQPAGPDNPDNDNPDNNDGSDDGVVRIVVHPPDRPAYTMEFADDRFRGGREVETGFRLDRVELPGEVITTLFDASRTKRRVLEADQIPTVLVDAIVAAEDRRFYDHRGVDPFRVLGAAWGNLRGRDRQGASTLTMQLAGSVFLDRSERTWGRKLPEVLIALILEGNLTKDEILTLYVNEIYLGHRGSFAISGFGEAAAAYFDKEIHGLTLSETATLVGMLPAPNAYAPTGDVARSMARRDLVLDAMYDQGRIDRASLDQARAEPVSVAEMAANTGLAPYMVDYVRKQLSVDFDEQALLEGGLRIHTTIDADLQRAAVAAVAEGVRNVEEQLAARNRGPGSGEPPVQAALIVLDPHTGAIKAMVGGRDYTESQYNRITEAFRQPGSVFKPFVYASAMETAFSPLPPPEVVGAGLYADNAEAGAGDDNAIQETRRNDDRPSSRIFWNTGPRGLAADEAAADAADAEERPEARRVESGTLETDRMITSVTTVVDEPTEFIYEGDKVYTPNNYGSVFHGTVTVREALQRSLNVPAVKIAERVGFDRVADMAHRAGLNADIQAFPSIALGAFEVTPIEIAGAWTIFANEGVRVAPRSVETVEDSEGNILMTYELDSRAVVRPEIAALMTHLLENVVNAGTAAGVRARGFTLPAAGKTGTSRDGWFAGYTRDLLAIAWVGFDDNRELGIDGSRSALPIWTEFMLAAERIAGPERSFRAGFVLPPGIDLHEIDPRTGALASPACPESETHAFIAGTAPTEFCSEHDSPGFSFPDAIRGIGRSLSGVFR